MAKIWTVARHEYWHHLRRRGFLISTFIMPVVLIVMFGVIIFVLLRSSQIKALGYVDQAGLFADVPPSLTWNSGVSTVTMVSFPDLARAEEGLRSGAIDAAFVIPADYLDHGGVDGYAMESLPSLAELAFTGFLRAVVKHRLSDELSPLVAEPTRAVASVVLDAPPTTAQRSGLSTLMPILFGVILLGSTFASGSYLMMAVAEEKEQRIMEILASSLSTYQMMAGKILGLGALALTQLFIWTGGGITLAIWGATQLGLIGGAGIAPGAVVLAFMLFFPMYFIIAATLSAIGAAVSSVQQGQQLTGVVTLLCTLPLWFLPILSDHPNGALATIFNIFPYTAAVTLLQRVTTSAVPLWQQIATVLWLWCAAGLLMIVAGRIVRVGLLRYGKALSLSELRKALRNGAA